MVSTRWLIFGYWVVAAVICGSIAKGQEAAPKPGKRPDKVVETTLKSNLIKEVPVKTQANKSSNPQFFGKSEIVPQKSKDFKLEPAQPSVRTRFNKRAVREESFSRKLIDRNARAGQTTRHNTFFPGTNYQTNLLDSGEHGLSYVTRNEDDNNRNVEENFWSNKYPENREGIENFNEDINGLGTVVNYAASDYIFPNFEPVNLQIASNLADQHHELGNIASNKNKTFINGLNSDEDIRELNPVFFSNGFQKSNYFPLNLQRPTDFNNDGMNAYQADDSENFSSSETELDGTQVSGNILDGYVPKLIKKYFKSNSEVDSSKEEDDDWTSDDENEFISANMEQKLLEEEPTIDEENTAPNNVFEYRSGVNPDISKEFPQSLGDHSYTMNEITIPGQEAGQKTDDDCAKDDQGSETDRATSVLQDLYEVRNGLHHTDKPAPATSADGGRQAPRSPRGWSPRVGKSKRPFEKITEAGRMKRSTEADILQNDHYLDFQDAVIPSWSAMPSKRAVDSDSLATFIDELVDESEIESENPWQGSLYRFLLSLIKSRMKEKILQSNSNSEAILRQELERAKADQQMLHPWNDQVNAKPSLYGNDRNLLLPEKQDKTDDEAHLPGSNTPVNEVPNEQQSQLKDFHLDAKTSDEISEGIEPPSEKRYLLGALAAPRFGYRRPFLIRNMAREFKPRKIFPAPKLIQSVVTQPESHRLTFSPRMGKRSSDGMSKFVDGRIASGSRKFSSYQYGDPLENSDETLPLPLYDTDLTHYISFTPRVGKRVLGLSESSEKRSFSFIPRAGKRTFFPRAGKRAPSFIPRAGKRAFSFIPRAGKRAFSFIPRAGKRAFSFIPRAGKRAFSFIPRAGKRAFSFIPRAGKRAFSFIPRAGKRAFSFIPRAGKRAFSFIPRAGKRTNNVPPSNFEQRSYSFTPRAAGKGGYSFIPRAGKRDYSFIPRAGKRGYSFIPRTGKRGYSFIPRAGKRNFSFIPRAGKRND